MRSIWKIVFFIATHEFGTCESQEKPTYNLPKFSNETVRQNFCDVHRMVESGKIKRRDALRGMDLHPVFIRYQLSAETGAIDEVNPDMAIDVMDELARRAGFRWRDSYGVTKAVESETWTELLLWAGGAYDLVGIWFVKTEDRAALGVLLDEGWWDTSLVMVKKKDEETGLNFFNFLLPFTPGLWGLIAITIVVSGMVYFLLDYLNSQTHAKEMDLGLKGSMFNAAWIFTGHTLHHPTSSMTRFLIFSLSFLCLMIVAAYTANLVSFLVTRITNKMEINHINDVIKYDLACCVDKNGPYQEFMERHYPTVNLVPISDPAYGGEIYNALARLECDIVLTELGSFEIRKRSEEFNPHCNIEWVGRKIYDNMGDFAVIDSVDLCSSLLSDVLAIHMLEMKSDGTLDTIWNNYRFRSDTGLCTFKKEESEDNDRLGVINMFGIFSLYFGVILFTIMCSLVQCHYAEQKRSTLGASSVSNVASVQELSMAPSGMGANIQQENLSPDWQRIELVGTKSFPPPLEECKKNTSLQLQKIWDKLLEIEKDREHLLGLLENHRKYSDDLRELLENDRKDRDDLCELLENDRHELRELFKRERREQSQRDRIEEKYGICKKD